MKQCIVCNEAKPLSKFGVKNDSYNNTCNKCRYEKSKNRHTLICKCCGADFKSPRKTTLFCSVKCRVENSKKPKQVVVCDYCKREFKRLASQFNGKNHKFCSIDCKNKGESLFYSGENAHCYNHEKPLEERIFERKYIDYYKWREEVYKRDNYTCQCCGDNSGGNLVAHHVFNYSEHEELRIDVGNGITLCKICHKLFHDTYGYRKNNRKQLEEFIFIQRASYL